MTPPKIGACARALAIDGTYDASRAASFSLPKNADESGRR